MKCNRIHIISRNAVMVLLTSAAIGYSSTAAAQESDDTTFVEKVDSTLLSDEEDPGADAEAREKLPDTIVLRTVPDTTVSRLQQLPSFVYANDPEYWLKKQEEENPKDFWYYIGKIFSNPYLRPVLFLIMGGILVYAIYRIVVGNSLFILSGRRNSQAGLSDELPLEDEDPDTKITQAIATSDYRSAIRWLYIKSLRGLNQRGLINLHAQATNHDYTRQMSSHRAGPDFYNLTRIYEFVWYGEFQPGEEQFKRIHQQFNNFNQLTGI